MRNRHREIWTGLAVLAALLAGCGGGDPAEQAGPEETATESPGDTALFPGAGQPGPQFDARRAELILTEWRWADADGGPGDDGLEDPAGAASRPAEPPSRPGSRLSTLPGRRPALSAHLAAVAL